MLLGTLSLGLAMTVASAASPGYWWFVVIFACGRPLLSATNALAQVSAAEQTGHRGPGLGRGSHRGGIRRRSRLIAIIDSLASGALGFRGMFALAVVPLALVPAPAHVDRGAGPLRRRVRPVTTTLCPCWAR